VIGLVVLISCHPAMQFSTQMCLLFSTITLVQFSVHLFNSAVLFGL
jgi:hypothetical protein